MLSFSQFDIMRIALENIILIINYVSQISMNVPKILMVVLTCALILMVATSVLAILAFN